MIIVKINMIPFCPFVIYYNYNKEDKIILTKNEETFLYLESNKNIAYTPEKKGYKDSSFFISFTPFDNSTFQLISGKPSETKNISDSINLLMNFNPNNEENVQMTLINLSNKASCIKIIIYDQNSIYMLNRNDFKKDIYLQI